MGVQCGVTRVGSVRKVVVESLASVEGEYANPEEIGEGISVCGVRLPGWLAGLCERTVLMLVLVSLFRFRVLCLFVLVKLGYDVFFF